MGRVTYIYTHTHTYIYVYMAGVVHACGGYAGCGVPRMQRLRRERPHLGRAVCSLRCLAARASGPLASPSSLLALLPRVVCSMRASSPSPTLTPTDPVPRGLLTLWAGLHIYTHAQGKHTHAHTHTHTLSLSLSLSLSRARALSLSHLRARAHTHTLSLSLFMSLSLPGTHTHQRGT